MQNLAASIFSDMVMEEAIKDKTIQVQNKMNGEILDKQELESEFKKLKHMEDGLEEDDDLDQDEANIMREIREKRMQEMRQNFSTKQENHIKGHGQY